MMPATLNASAKMKGRNHGAQDGAAPSPSLQSKTKEISAAQTLSSAYVQTHQDPLKVLVVYSPHQNTAALTVECNAPAVAAPNASSMMTGTAWLCPVG